MTPSLSARGRAARAPVSVIVQGGVSPTQIEPFRFVPDRNCVAVRRGGEQREGNGRPAGNERDSARCIGEHASQWRSPYPCGVMTRHKRCRSTVSPSGAGKGMKLRDGGASGGWRQDVRKHDCVKLGDPGGAEDRRGVRARIVVRKRRNGRGAKAGQEDGCGKAGTMELNNPCQWWRRLRKRKTSRPPGCGGTITSDRPHVGGPGNGIKGDKRQPLERNLQMEPKCLLSWAGLFSSSTVMSRNADPCDKGTINWKAGCEKFACPVWREG